MRGIVLGGVLLGVAAGFAPARPAEAQMLFLARRAIGTVEHMVQGPSSGGAQPTYDIATVVLEAPASNVYEKVMQRLKTSDRVTVVDQDATRRRVDFSDGKQTVGITVTDLEEKLSQLVIASAVPAGTKSDSSLVLESVLTACKEFAVECTVQK